MKTILIIISVMLASSQWLIAQKEVLHDSTQIKQLEGIWTIDLRPAPNADAYLKEFVVVLETMNVFSGEFYGSAIKNGLINSNWEKIYFAFSTRDDSHEYYHSGFLLEDKIYGTTYCPGREFVAPWSGIKNK